MLTWNPQLKDWGEELNLSCPLQCRSVEFFDLPTHEQDLTHKINSV